MTFDRARSPEEARVGVERDGPIPGNHAPPTEAVVHVVSGTPMKRLTRRHCTIYAS